MEKPQDRHILPIHFDEIKLFLKKISFIFFGMSLDVNFVDSIVGVFCWMTLIVTEFKKRDI